MRLDAVRAALVGALFAAIVTFPGLGNGTLWDNSETAYGEVAREILLTHDWVVMHLNGQPWYIQPPLYFWIAAISAKLLGLSSFALRLPSALATVAMGGAVGYAAARIAGARAGALAAVVLSTCLMQAVVGRLAIMDALLDLFVTVAILWWYRALEPPAGPDERRRTRAVALLCGTVALALGTLAKGPVAPVLVLLVLGPWLVWERQRGGQIVWPTPAALLGAGLLFVVVSAPWFVAESLRVGPSAIGELIGHYSVGRYVGVIENQPGPWWYYVPVLILGFFPWIAFVPVAVAAGWTAAREPGGSFARLCLLWTLLPLAFFSFAQTKLPNYVAVVLPPLAILVALWFERLAAGIGRRAALVSAGTIPLFIAAVGFALHAFIRSNRLESAGAAVAPQVDVLAGAMLAGSVVTVLALARRDWVVGAPYLLAATAGGLVLFIALVAEPVADALKPIPALARAIDADRAPGAMIALRGVSGENALVYYTAPGVRVIGDDPQDYVALICKRREVYLITRSSDVPELERLTRLRGRDVSTTRSAERATLLHVDGPPCAGVSR